MYETHWHDLARNWHKAPAACRERVLDEILDGKGVPTYIRSQIWMVACGAEKKLKSFPRVYEDHLAEVSRRLEATTPTDFAQVELQIRKDIKRTYPLFLRNATNAAQTRAEAAAAAAAAATTDEASAPDVTAAGDDQLWQHHERALYNVLCACALASGGKEASYHQGLNYMAALLLILMHERAQHDDDDDDRESSTDNSIISNDSGGDRKGRGARSPDAKSEDAATVWRRAETRAFWVLQSLLQDYNLDGIYDCHTSFLQQFLDQFDLLVRRFLPRLHRHLEHGLQGGYPVVLFAMDWFTTMFSYSMRVDAVYLIWDLFIVARLDETLYVAGLAILLHLRDRLMAIVSFEEMADQFKRLVRSISARELLASIRRVVERIIPSELIPPGRSTLANIDRAMHDASNELTTTDFDATQLVRAVQLGDAASVDVEIAKYNFPVRLLERMLLRATMLGHAAVVQCMLSVCDPSCRSSLATLEGLTPLHICALMGHPTVARVLLSAGAGRGLRCQASVLRILFPPSRPAPEEGFTPQDVAEAVREAMAATPPPLSDAVPPNVPPSPSSASASTSASISPPASPSSTSVSAAAMRAAPKPPPPPPSASSTSAPSAVERVLDGGICLTCGRLLQRLPPQGKTSFMASIIESLTPDWDEAVPRASDKRNPWDGDLCAECASAPSPRKVILDAPLGDKTWHCVNCRSMLLGERTLQCRRCNFVCCAACTFTRRKLLPKHMHAVPVCSNCHHVLRSCPCDDSSWRSYQVKCDHHPFDNVVPPETTCSCEQCLHRRYTLRSPAQAPRTARYDAVRPLFNAKEAFVHGFWASRNPRSMLAHPAALGEEAVSSRDDLLRVISDAESFVVARTKSSTSSSSSAAASSASKRPAGADPSSRGAPRSPLASSENGHDGQATAASRPSSYRDFRAELIEFYTVWNPSQLGQVDSLLAKYKGREDQLMNSLHSMYAKR